MEKAQVSLPSKQEVMVTRSFKAPSTLVYRAFTEPALVRRWSLGYPGWSMPVCEMDVRVGGSYRWRWRNDKDQTEFGFDGVYRKLEPGALIVHSEIYDAGTAGFGESGAETLVTLTFAEKNGVTTLTTLIKYASEEARDAMIATGMTDGMEKSYQLIEQILSTLSSQPEAHA